MKIGVPKELKTAESRVALVPKHCGILVQQGHEVFVQSLAGQAAGFSDDAYQTQGVRVLNSTKDLYDVAQMIVKVKEPQPQEVPHLRKDHLLFGYVHLAASPPLQKAFAEIGLTVVAFETLQEEDGSKPLLIPMSEIAGRVAVQMGSSLLYTTQGGRGVLLGGTHQQPAGEVLILGAGVVGGEAASLALGMGASVTILDINTQRLSELRQKFPQLKTQESSPEVISSLLPNTDLLVGTIYVLGKEAPKLVSEAQVRTMRQGSVVVDVAIDQGGCVATSKPCSYEEPYFCWNGIIHSAIANLPGAVPVTASQRLSEAIVSYVGKLAKGEWTAPLEKAINVKNHQLMEF